MSAFATGFFNSASDEITKRQDYIRTKRAKDRDFLMTYGVQAVTGAKSKVNKYVTTGMQLESKGLKKENINYLVDTSGPQALTSLYDLVKDMTPDQLSSNVFNKMVEDTAGYAGRTKDGMSYEDTINRAFGLYKDNVTDDPAENEKVGFWSSMLFDPNAADAALDEKYIGGYTGRDIKRIMGTVAPSMTAPLAVDFSLLPKIHSDTVLLRYASDRKVIMEDQADNYLNSILPDGEPALAAEPAADKNKRLRLQKAIKDKDYRVFLELVPTIRDTLLTFDKQTRGGLSNNASFLSIPGFENFFIDEAAKREKANGKGPDSSAATISAATSVSEDARTGADAQQRGQSDSETTILAPRRALQSKHDRAKKQFAEIPDLNDLLIYATDEAAIRSGNEFFIVGGDYNADTGKYKRLTIGRNPQAGKSPFEDRGSFDENVEYFLNAFTVGGVGLAEDANTQGGELLKGIAKGMYIAPAYFRASMLAIDRFMTKLPGELVNFLNSETEAGELRSALVKDQTDIMALIVAARESGRSTPEAIEALEERLRKGIESLPENLQGTVIKLAEEIDDINIDISEVLPTAAEESSSFGSWWRSLGNDGDKSEPAFNDPEDVRQSGAMPYSEMMPATTNFSDEEYDALPVIQSFDTIKAQLKSGELRQGSSFVYRARTYTIDQTGSGPIGTVDIREYR